MRFQSLKTRLSMLLIGITFIPNLIISRPAYAKGYCKVEKTERTLFSHRANNLNQKIESAMQSAELEGEIQQIFWADGIQVYNFIGGKPEIYAPSADLFPMSKIGNKAYIYSHEKIGSHYKVDTPAWEYLGQRLIAKEITKIDGAEEKDAPWLKVKTDKEGLYVLRIETRGGVPPEKNCEFNGLLGFPYQTIYLIVETNNQQASQ